MKIKLFALAGVASVFFGSPALAETCNVQVTGPAEHWKFLHVYDVATGEVVLRQAIKAGDSRPVEVTGDKIRVDWKMPGDRNYRAGSVALCKAGNFVKI